MGIEEPLLNTCLEKSCSHRLYVQRWLQECQRRHVFDLSHQVALIWMGLQAGCSWFCAVYLGLWTDRSADFFFFLPTATIIGLQVTSYWVTDRQRTLWTVDMLASDRKFAIKQGDRNPLLVIVLSLSSAHIRTFCKFNVMLEKKFAWVFNLHKRS